LAFNKIKEHASDLQTFLSLPHLISKANMLKIRHRGQIQS
jgi:hypothetical protein